MWWIFFSEKYNCKRYCIRFLKIRQHNHQSIMFMFLEYCIVSWMVDNDRKGMLLKISTMTQLQRFFQSFSSKRSHKLFWILCSYNDGIMQDLMENSFHGLPHNISTSLNNAIVQDTLNCFSIPINFSFKETQV